jgi:hypothetical protein
MKQDVRTDMNKVISELEKQGIKANSYKVPSDKEGLGDVVEATLLKVGITEQRFKDFFGLKECNCTKRKQWLNGLFSWHKKQK